MLSQKRRNLKKESSIFTKISNEMFSELSIFIITNNIGSSIIRKVSGDEVDVIVLNKDCVFKYDYKGNKYNIKIQKDSMLYTSV